MVKEYYQRVQHEFPKYVLPFKGKPITYVEIGCWLGGSAQYVANNVLTHPQSRGFGIDPYLSQCRKHKQPTMDEVKAEAKRRLQPLEDAGRWTWIYSRSQDVLSAWPHGAIDLLYIDGSHHAHDVLLDFCAAWRWLRAGSVVVLDDYSLGLRKRGTGTPPEVPDAVEAIKLAFHSLVREIGCASQYALEVVDRPQPGTGLST